MTDHLADPSVPFRPAVVAAGAEPVEDVGRVPAAPGSELLNLHARLGEARAKLYTDLEVPRWKELLGFSVVARYRPIAQTKLTQALERHDSDDDPEHQTLFYADLLVNAVVGIYAIIGGKPRSLLGSKRWETFASQELFEQLGPRMGPDGDAVMTDEPSAINCARRLYFTDPDLNTAANLLIAWSAQSSQTAQLDFPTP